MTYPLERASAVAASRNRELNDAFRRADVLTALTMGRRVDTSGVQSLPRDVVADIWREVVTYDQFNPDSDSRGEHDFGQIDHPVAGRVFWKIERCEVSSARGVGNQDELDAMRILTVMLACER